MIFPNLASIIAEETQGNYTFEHIDVNGYNTLYLKKGGEVIMYDMVNRPIKDIYELNMNNLTGDVLICGLGIGFSVFPIKDLAGVDSVTVIENDSTIISMMAPYLSGVTIINADANTYIPTKKYDSIFLDIWDDSNLIEKYSHTMRYQPYLKIGGYINYLDFYNYYTIQSSYPNEWKVPSVSLGNGVTSGVSLFRAGAGGVQYSFDAGSDDEWSANIPLEYCGIDYDGSNIEITIGSQLSIDGGGADDIQWEVQYSFMDSGDDSDGAGTIFTDTVDVSTRVSGQVYIDTLPTLLSGGAIGDKYLQISIKRDAFGGGSDTYLGDAWVTYIKMIKV